MIERVVGNFLMIAVFPPAAVLLYAALVIFLGGWGVLASAVVSYASAVCMAVLPAGPRFTPRMADVLAVSCMAFLGLFSVHLTASSIDVGDFGSFLARAANVPLFILSVMGGAVSIVGAAAAYFALLQIVPDRNRWAQWISLPLLALAAILALHRMSSLLAAQGISIDFLAAVWASPFDLLAWIFLLMIFAYRINVRYVLRPSEKTAS